MELAQTLLLFLQVGHFLVLGLSVFFLLRFFHTGRKPFYKGALGYGLFSIPLAILLFFILLHFGTMLQAILYGISIVVGFLPLIILITGKA